MNEHFYFDNLFPEVSGIRKDQGLDESLDAPRDFFIPRKEM